MFMLFSLGAPDISFRGGGVRLEFLYKRPSLTIICIMKCKQTVYQQNKGEKIGIQTDCCDSFPLYN